MSSQVVKLRKEILNSSCSILVLHLNEMGLRTETIILHSVILNLDLKMSKSEKKKILVMAA